MHELSVSQSLVNTVVSEAKKLNAASVISVDLVVGKCSCAMPEILKDYFKIMTEGTIAEGADLRITRENGIVLCNDCGRESELEDFRLTCPVCHSHNVTLRSGRDIYINSMEIED